VSKLKLNRVKTFISHMEITRKEFWNRNRGPAPALKITASQMDPVMKAKGKKTMERAKKIEPVGHLLG
jgi:hypothetical protein